MNWVVQVMHLLPMDIQSLSLHIFTYLTAKRKWTPENGNNIQWNVIIFIWNRVEELIRASELSFLRFLTNAHPVQRNICLNPSLANPEDLLSSKAEAVLLCEERHCLFGKWIRPEKSYYYYSYSQFWHYKPRWLVTGRLEIGGGELRTDILKEGTNSCNISVQR
jgi:hypothetical protein